MHQEALVLSPLPRPLNVVTSPPEDASTLTQTQAAPKGPSPQPRGSSPQPRGSSPQPQALSPVPQATAVKPASLPSARQLARVKIAKAEALIAAAQALQSTQEDGANFAVPGRNAAVVKHFLAQAGMLVNLPARLHAACIAQTHSTHVASNTKQHRLNSIELQPQQPWSRTQHELRADSVEYVMGTASRERKQNQIFFTACKSKLNLQYIVMITSDASSPSLA